MTVGIDVYWSNYDGGRGTLDPTEYDFYILQAYDGATGEQADEHNNFFTRNAHAVDGAGKVLMTYFWLNRVRPVEDQVASYLAQVDGWPTVFHWIDYEENRLSPDLSDRALELLPPNSGVYSNGGQYPGQAADGRPWWGAGYPNIVGGRPDPVIHQYADNPHDMNVIVDDAWYAGVVGHVAPAPAPKPAPKHEDDDMLVVTQTTNIHTLYTNSGSTPISSAEAQAFVGGGAAWWNNVQPLQALSIFQSLDPVGFARAFGKK